MHRGTRISGESRGTLSKLRKAVFDESQPCVGMRLFSKPVKSWVKVESACTSSLPAWYAYKGEQGGALQPDLDTTSSPLPAQARTFAVLFDEEQGNALHSRLPCAHLTHTCGLREAAWKCSWSYIAGMPTIKPSHATPVTAPGRMGYCLTELNLSELTAVVK